MISRTTKKFWKAYYKLPSEIKKSAKKSFLIFQKNPFHPGLNFKRIYSNQNIYSIRISKDYRALAIVEDENIIWFWIGSHSEYDKIVQTLRV